MLNRYTYPGIGLLVLRLTAGVIFVAHGSQKLFTIGFAGTTSGIVQAGIPFPAISAALLIAAEFLGGFLLIVGLLTRLAALALAFSMFIAITVVHLKSGFFLPQGYEFALVMFGISLSLLIAGPGAYALDNKLFSSDERSSVREVRVRRVA